MVQIENVKAELSQAVKKIIGHNSITQFAHKCGMVDVQMLVNMLNGRLEEFPDRKILRKLADASEGRVTYRYLYDICGYSDRDPEEDRSWAKWVPQRGEIYTVDLGMYGIDSEQQGIRPFVIVSNNLGNAYSSIVVGCPLTSRNKNQKKIHVPVEQKYGLLDNSYIMAEHIRSISKRRFFYNGEPWRITTLPQKKMLELQYALEIELGFEPAMFEEDKAFKIIEHIKILQARSKQEKDLVELLNEKINALMEYCSKYCMDYRYIISEYNRLATA